MPCSSQSSTFNPDSVQDKDYWRSLVNVELNLRVPQAIELVGTRTTTLHMVNQLPLRDYTEHY